jgi:transposase
MPDENTRRRLDVAFMSAGHLERALTRWALTNLESMRRTTRWRDACAMPTGLSASGEVNDAIARRTRNAALNALRKEFCLSEYDFTKRILELRRDSRWIGDHVPSSSALVHATQVWESFAAHLFRGTGLPTVPRPGDKRVLQGYTRYVGRAAPTEEEAEKFTAKGEKPPKARSAGWSGLSLRNGQDGFALHLHPSRVRARHLVIPVATLGGSDQRESWYLEDPTSWRQIKIVRREVRNHFVYEAHLLCAKESYRNPSRYANTAEGVVGIDSGVSSLAAVGIGLSGALTDALLIRPSAQQLEQRRIVARKRRRTQRALERSRRATNPSAYGPDRHGRAGRGPRRPGTRLTASKAYRATRRALRDERRRERESRVITTNLTAVAVLQRCGTNIVTEDVAVKAWQRTWGRSISNFAPSEMISALERETRLAGGSFTKVPCRLGLTQTCHCGAVKKKSLAERWHRCEVCGSGFNTAPVDRDLHSAYLAAFVTATTSPIASTLDTDRALAAWSGAEAPLVAVSGDPQSRRTSQPHSRGASSWSRLKASDRAGRAIASDVDPDSLGRAEDPFLSDVGVRKAHAEWLRYEASTTEIDLPRGRQLRLDG